MTAALQKAVDALKAKSRSLLFTALIGIGAAQILLPAVFDALFYGIAVGIVWLALKLGVGK